MSSLIRRASPDDVDAIAAIHRQAFTRQSDSEVWVRATVAAWPRMLVYVLVHEGEVAGYIFWAQKSGIRPAAVVELDQVAVLLHLRGQGLGELLIKESLAELRTNLKSNGQSLKSILVSTRADNKAQRLYKKILGASVVAEIDNMYSSTEVIMLAEAVDA